MGGINSAVKSITNAVKKVVNSVVKVVKAVVNNVVNIINKVVESVKKIVDTIVSVVSKVVKFVVDFATNLVNSVIEFIRTGDIAAIAMTIVAAVMTGGMSLVLQFGVPALTQTMVQHGMISESWAMAINIGAQIFAMWYAWDTNGISNLQSFFEGLGVSVETALWLSTSIHTAMSIIGPLMALKGIYDAYKDTKALKDAYEAMLAEFEAWKAGFGKGSYISRLEASDAEIQSYSDNSYYRKLPGQPGYSPFYPSQPNFVSTDVARPAHWVDDTVPAYNEDRNISKLMWDDKFANPMAEFDIVPYNFQNGTTYNTYVSAGTSSSNSVDSGSGTIAGRSIISIATRNIKVFEYEKVIAENKNSAAAYMANYFKIQAAMYDLNNYDLYIDDQRSNLKTQFKTDVIDKLITSETFKDESNKNTIYIRDTAINRSSAQNKVIISANDGIGADGAEQIGNFMAWEYGKTDDNLFMEKEIADAYYNVGYSTGKLGGGWYFNGDKSKKYFKATEIENQAYDALIDASSQFDKADDSLLAQKSAIAKEKDNLQKILKENYNSSNLESALSYLSVADVVNIYEAGGFNNISSGFNNIVDMGFNISREFRTFTVDSAQGSSYQSFAAYNVATGKQKRDTMYFGAIETSGFDSLHYSEIKDYYTGDSNVYGKASSSINLSSFNGYASDFIGKIQKLNTNNKYYKFF